MIDRIYTDLISGHRMVELRDCFQIETADGEVIGQRVDFNGAAFLLRQLRGADARACQRLRQEHDQFRDNLIDAALPKKRTTPGRLYA